MADIMDLLNTGVSAYFDTEKTKVQAASNVTTAKAQAMIDLYGADEIDQNVAPGSRAGQSKLAQQQQQTLIYVGLGVVALIGVILVLK